MMNDTDKLKIIYCGELGRVEAAKHENLTHLTLANIVEIGEDKISDLCPFGDVVFQDKDGNYYEMQYSVSLKPLTAKEVADRNGQRCFPHQEFRCARCLKGDHE